MNPSINNAFDPLIISIANDIEEHVDFQSESWEDDVRNILLQWNLGEQSLVQKYNEGFHELELKMGIAWKTTLAFALILSLVIIIIK